ncbi:unnamed protein product [Pocillopora meandrina]|uniref:BRICHOS domain-containing protein n=1 Tax=Pocillopora meandrina TaxID=46732 RepID=A0AAU9WU22_9CNID|nr:unnamed protein product [Pocillopora meandrina]
MRSGRCTFFSLPCSWLPHLQHPLVNAKMKIRKLRPSTKSKSKMVTKSEQEIKIDTEKQTETYHFPKTKSSGAEVDEVYDFKRNLVMRRIPELKACFLSESTENAPKPQDLKNALDKQSVSGSSQSVNTTEDNYEAVGTVNNRTTLSDEMAAMCAKFPIYRIKRKQVTMSVEKENVQGI